MALRIIIGADIVPTESNQGSFSSGLMKEIVDEKILDELKIADYRIFNLECPLTDNLSPIQKSGPCLAAPTACINGISALHIDFLTLANNHMLDQSEKGIESTIQVLDKSGIAYSGVGKTLEKASAPFIVEINNLKLGIYCCCEHEFSIAGEKSEGVNPFDPFESLDHIFELKKHCDILICLYHGGKEHYRYPTPYLQKVCHKIIEKGADIVVCQHSHCVGCEEKYLNGTIVYGQGNFLFDRSNSDYWKTGLLIKLDIDEKVDVSYLPIVKNGKGVSIAEGEIKDAILDGFHKRTEEILKDGFIQDRFDKEAEETKAYYLRKFRGNTLLDKILCKVSESLYEKLFFGRLSKLEMLNCIECEPHRDFITHILGGDCPKTSP